MTRVITVANTKGGSAKTTTAAYLAHAVAANGYQVCGIDADPAGSLLRWREHAGWSLPVVGMPSKRLHLDLVNVMGNYGWLIIDTPPVEDQLGIVHSAIRAATDVVVPVGASTMELDRLSPILDAVDDATAMRDEPPQVRVLLTRVHPQATSTTVAREVITEHFGRHVLTAAVPTLERYKQAFGETPHLPPGDPYALAAEELNGRTTQL